MYAIVCAASQILWDQYLGGAKGVVEGRRVQGGENIISMGTKRDNRAEVRKDRMEINWLLNSVNMDFK